LCVALLGGAIGVLVWINLPGPAPDAISIPSLQGVRTEYAKGEAISTAGLTLLAVYDDNTIKSITRGFTISPKTATTVGDLEITVTFRGKKDKFIVKVGPAIPVSMTINNPSAKTEFSLSEINSPETLNLSGLQVRIRLTDNNTQTLHWTNDRELLDISITGSSSIVRTVIIFLEEYPEIQISFNIRIV